MELIITAEMPTLMGVFVVFYYIFLISGGNIMKFSATSSIGSTILQNRDFNTTDSDFVPQVRRFLNEVGIAVEVHFMLKNIKQTNQNNWNKFSMTEDIVLTFFFGNIYNPRKLTGDCKAKHSYTIQAADPGIYESQLTEISYRIPDLLLPDFMDFFDFIDWKM